VRVVCLPPQAVLPPPLCSIAITSVEQAELKLSVMECCYIWKSAFSTLSAC